MEKGCIRKLTNAMIKFFRNIRKKLLNEGKTSKYFKYAIGEIVLVVIGILIALQINNWNEHRKEQIREKKLLYSLKEDFQATKSNLLESLDYYPELMERLEKQLSYLGYNKAQITDTIKTQLTSTFFPNTKIFDGSLNVVLSSENLQLISSDSLKKHLTAYPSYLSSFKEQETEAKKLVLNEHRPILEHYFSLTDWYADDERYPDLHSRTVPSDLVGLVNDRSFQNVLVKEIYHIAITFNEAETLLNRTDQILEEIEKEYKKN